MTGFSNDTAEISEQAAPAPGDVLAGAPAPAESDPWSDVLITGLPTGPMDDGAPDDASTEGQRVDLPIAGQRGH